MANSGWAKLNNAPYKRICPGLCPTCVHLNTTAVEGWLSCDALGKLLSNPHTTPGRCDSYEAGEQKLSDERIQELHNDALEMKELKKNRRNRR